MPSFGTRSRNNLDEAHEDLQILFKEVIKHYDCSVICGHRSKADQNKAFFDGRSKLKFPRSKHNSLPSNAVDVVPYPIDWKDMDRFYHFAGFVFGVAVMLDIDLRWGGDWDQDTDLHDQSFMDLPHFELA